MSYKDYISDDEIFDEDDLDEEDFDEDDLDEEDDPDEYEFKVVGVTFANDDGTNRQELLRKIKSREEPFKGFINYSLKVYSYEGKTAVAVLANGIMIGNVPKENAENIAEHMKYIDKVFVCVFGGEDGKKYGAVVRLTVIPPRIDVEKLIADRRVASAPAPAPENPTLSEPDKKETQKNLKVIGEWLKNPISVIAVVLIALFFVSSVSLSIMLFAGKSDDRESIFESQSTTNLIVEGKFTLNKDQLIEQINALPNVSYTCDKSLIDEQAYFSGDIQEGVDLTIVCDTDKTTVKGLIIVAKNEYAEEGGAFVGWLFHILFPKKKKKKIDEFINKSEMKDMRYGDTHSCYIDSAFFTVEMTEEEITYVILPKSVK